MLTKDESAELAVIQELDIIFTSIDSKLTAQNQWSQSKLEDLSDKEQETDANTVTHLHWRAHRTQVNESTSSANPGSLLFVVCSLL